MHKGKKIVFDIAIIGAGASGLMLASNLKNQNICIIDSNSKIGEKIRVSGGAKCNITNEKVKASNYLGDKSFCENILKNFSNKELLNFLNQNGVHPKINPKIVKGTYFCNSSKDVIEMFSKLTTHVKKYLDTKVLDIEYDRDFTIITAKNTIKAKRVVVASGGLSYESLGASSFAFDIAKKFGHTLANTKPALVGFTVQKEQFWFKNLSGISTPVEIKVDNKSFFGSLLFAHKGCSGPAVLNSSLYWQKGKIVIDFLPNKKIGSFLQGNKKISTALPLPKRFLSEFLTSISLEDKSVNSLSKEEKNKLELLKNYQFSPAGTFGYTKAEVTSGGILLDEIDNSTFESKKQNRLFFIGECLDLTGELGGYNFQIVFSEAILCSKHLNSEVKDS
ncbi:NAD(P)/FAD-dependent oxidoreductase [Halarcobacter ebronensis]|uniref:Aminoacetone oxidase family FAD-binding enzyme n=1 Tax=Halarcobacter ebronensis TaxID=1462615 RepID=A0A4Q1AME5_9BACT|nr:aminoacetone oxidase family FAD-binding enzyme [Halarcobacter ebronensis]QKF81122.1 flavoprotein, HI0933 family [Halarcobacter ebronensis]RXK06425.1 aminoacetone oxidase family FAD-binding enzyme [Halarcobacter ebronensis]